MANEIISRRPFDFEFASIEFDVQNPPKVPIELIKVIDDLQLKHRLNYREIARQIFRVQLTSGEARYLLTYANAWANKAKSDLVGDTLTLNEFEKAAGQAVQSKFLMKAEPGSEFKAEAFVYDFFEKPENAMSVQLMSLQGQSRIAGQRLN